MAEAAERFRREMDAMREQLREPVVDLVRVIVALCGVCLAVIDWFCD